MALKFRRGTTAQKSGSLAFGEPFINTDLNTLQIGGASGDITLGTTGESSAFAGVSVSASSFISGSGLKITGNAAIDGNLTLGGAITIGDATADTVNVVASLSSSLIPSNDIAFNVGRNDRRYKELYANVISSSIVELISGSGTEFRLKNTTANTEYHIRNTNTGSFSIHEQTTGRTIFFSPSASLAGELNMFLGGNVNFSGSITANNITATGTISGSTFTGLGNLTTYSSSVNSRLGTLEGKDISITLTGDVTGTGTITDLANVSFATTIAANSVALGTDTTGDYVSSLVAGTNITLSNNTGEGATPTIGLTNNAITIAGTSTALGGTITAATIASAIPSAGIANAQLVNSAITIAGTSTSLGGTISAATIGNAIGAVSSSAQVTASVFGAVSGDVTISSTGVATIAANSVALGTDTTGNYVASLVQGTGVTITNNSGEGATPTIAIGQAVATSDNVRFNSLGIGMAASATAGRIDAANDIVAFSSSDRNFKENITPIENPIDKIRKISGNTYDWKAELKDVHGYEGNDVGVIAQEIEAVLPQLVQTRENGYKAVKYDKLVALLIEGMKEQQLQIEQLRIDLDNCRNKGL
jgi:hypothetical protein